MLLTFVLARSASSNWRDTVSALFSRVEDVVYVALGAMLAASAAVMLATCAIAFVHALTSGEPAIRAVDELLNRILLLLMIVEILYTVQVSFSEHALVPEPFLIVGLIATIRRLLVLTAEFARLVESNTAAFRAAMLELGLLTVMIVALVVSLVVLKEVRTAARVRIPPRGVARPHQGRVDAFRPAN